MSMDERMERLHEQTLTLAEAFLEVAADKKSYVCPCGHGSGTAKKKDGKNYGDGLTFDNRGRWHCFSCGRKGDIIDLYQYKHGDSITFKQAMEELEALAGILPPVTEPKPQQKKGKTSEQVKSEFWALSFLPLKDSYRGISPAVLEAYKVRGCKEYSNPLRAGTFHGPRPAVVFPTADGCAFVRALKPKEGERCDKWDIGGKKPFNLQALTAPRPVFVTEGVIDALSIIEAGGDAVGLSGTDGMGALVEVLKKTPSPSGLLLAPDNDKAGLNALNDWGRALDAVGVEWHTVDVADLYGGAKDANEALCNDPEAFRERVAAIYASYEQITNPWGAGCSALVENVEAGGYTPIPTGVPAIDSMLGGGFFPGQLIVLTAPPAKGKTSFCQGLVEGMARRQRDFTCLYFCFEMSREQLQARSIARLMHGMGQDVSALDVMQGKLGWREGVKAYEREIAGKVAYYGLGSGLSSSRIEEVTGVIKKGIRYNAAIGKPAPFVVIDYLQLVEVEGKEEQEAIKATMAALKDIAIKHKTVIIAIGANNREANKAGTPSMYGGRGSSSIEYGADIVLSLTSTEELEVERMQKDCKLSLVMPKGRFYDNNARADFEFKGKYSEFVPVEQLGRPMTDKENAAVNDLLSFE